MKVLVASNAQALGRQAAAEAAKAIGQAISLRGSAHLLLATGTSQLATLGALVAQVDIQWSQVTGFHLDEYLGIGPDHPASFCRFLHERFVTKTSPNDFHFIDGLARDPRGECDRLSRLISAVSIDVALMGIGENAHLAFNDPPADFETTSPFITVELDQACRRQQLGEGWFESLDAVPTSAISMSIKQILKSSHIICSVPDQRKARAVVDALQGPLTPQVPASILRTHPSTTIYLDPPAASLLTSNEFGLSADDK